MARQRVPVEIESLWVGKFLVLATVNNHSPPGDASGQRHSVPIIHRAAADALARFLRLILSTGAASQQSPSSEPVLPAGPERRPSRNLRPDRRRGLLRVCGAFAACLSSFSAISV